MKINDITRNIRDLIFKRSKGRTDIEGGDERLICSNLRNKIFFNPNLSDKFLILAGHMGITTIGEERKKNPFKHKFL